MTWNWQQKDWPNFRYDKAQLEQLEAKFLKKEGMLLAAFKHLNTENKEVLAIEIISNEAVNTSASKANISIGTAFNHP